SRAKSSALFPGPVLVFGLVICVLVVSGLATGWMTVVALALAAMLLSLERLFYLWVWNNPRWFMSWCDRNGICTAVDGLDRAMVLFKLLQLAVFAGWCFLREPGLSWPGDGAAGVAGGSLILLGQFLNYSVFRRLGRVGVFYGIRFGHRVRWYTEVPFSVLEHPQYAGALVSIWGLFLLIRFPQPDWFWLPALETLYYAAGAYLEQ